MTLNIEIDDVLARCKAGICSNGLGNYCCRGDRHSVEFYAPDFFGKGHSFWGKGEYCDGAIETCRQHNWIVQ